MHLTCVFIFQMPELMFPSIIVQRGDAAASGVIAGTSGVR